MRKPESSPEMHDSFYASDDEEEVLIDADSSSSSSSPRKQSMQGSFAQTPVWPQSYRQSIDIYSHLGSPATISSLSPRTSRIDLSRPSSSYQRRTESTENLTSWSALLLPAKEEDKASLKKGPFTESQKYFVEFVDHGLGGKCSATQGTLNGINVLCGVGILSTPYALKEGGWLSLGMFLALAIISFYTGVLLRRCLESQPGLVTYPDIGQAAFGITGRVIISIFLYMELYAACVEYLILEGDNLSAVFPKANLNLHGFNLTATELFTIISAICVLPTVWLRDLSLLSYVSAVGVLASLAVVLCVTWIGVADGVGFNNDGPVLKISTLPVSIGIYGFCFSGHSVFPNIYSSLKTPSQFPGILTISFLFCALLYGGMAVMGFTMFGDETHSQITLNLPSHLVASKVAVWCTIINPFTKYALSITPVALSLEELLPSSDLTLKNYGFSLLVRTILVLSTLLVALLLPLFGYVMAFIGSFLSMLLCLIFPSTFFLRLAGYKASLLQKLCCFVIILIGLVCCIAGTYSSVAGMIKSL